MDIKSLNKFLKSSNINLKSFEIHPIESRKELLKFFKDNSNLYYCSGVYVFEKNSKIIYIGSCGKLKRVNNNIVASKNGIGSRLVRSNFPYSFIDDSLCYNRLKDSGNSKKKINYKNHISLNDIRIVFYETSLLISPTYIEHILLQYFLDKTNNLPLINNQL